MFFVPQPEGAPAPRPRPSRGASRVRPVRPVRFFYYYYYFFFFFFYPVRFFFFNFPGFYQESGPGTPSMEISGSKSPRGLIESPVGWKNHIFKLKTISVS